MPASTIRANTMRRHFRVMLMGVIIPQCPTGEKRPLIPGNPLCFLQQIWYIYEKNIKKENYKKMGETKKSSILAGIVLFAFLLIMLLAEKQYGYLLFHVTVEMISVVISYGIFVFGWQTKAYLKNSYLLFLSVAFLPIGTLDLIHAMAYKGMGVFPGLNESNIATELWIAARYTQGIAFFGGFFFLRRRLHPYLAFSAFFTLFLLFLLVIFVWDIFPDCYRDGIGLTPFKITSEYVIALLLAGSLALLYLRRRHFDPKVFRLLFAALVILTASEMAFTLYTDVYGYFNFAGHLLKFVAYYLIYLAIIDVGLTNPIQLFIQRLQESEDARERQRELLIQQERLASMGEMISHISHHWRQPLNGVGIKVQDILDVYELGRLDHGYLETKVYEIMTILHKMSDTLDSFQSFVSYPQKQERLELAGVITEVVALAAPRGENIGAVIETALEPGLTVTGSKNLLAQVLFHLLTNALEALEEHRPQWPRITIETTRNLAMHPVLTISDNGGGIDPALMGRIFEPFFTTKELARRTGTGLYFAKLHIERHMHGQLSVRNIPDGSRFTITFPLS